eukprot:NODE_11000_length_479_cov_12.573034_g10345_i0.p1 GENE.NODE_11000_length_479_cov_12.573034_g10345_i0~~NODE_11000_length_479_cov_12.573034_g10345_i0.p1  ORF type:complete len:143 (-),score=24.87 NODE_11000_length_479_cov_12.573034_g10345_i0:49-414(-)
MSAATKKATKKPNHPKYLDMIKEAISTVKGPKGASRNAILKYLEAKYGTKLGPNFKTTLRTVLRKLVASNKLVPVKGSFKVSKAEKEKSKKTKKAKTKKAKTTTKKTKKSYQTKSKESKEN